MNKADTVKAIKALGMLGQWKADVQEWRVTYRPGELDANVTIDNARREECAYYTDDAQDAIDSARAMRQWKDNANAKGFAYPEF